MAEVIHIKDRLKSPRDSLITSRPWEFRWSDWKSRHFVQMARSCSEELERLRRDDHRGGQNGHRPLPTHFVLKGGTAYTMQAAFAYRENEEKMREVYYLAGLIDCMINRVNPLLRTDLIRELYKKVMTLKSLLDMNWYGSLDEVLLPLDERFFSTLRYREELSGAGTMKAMYRIIRKGTDAMFDSLSLEYVFYTPGRGV